MTTTTGTQETPNTVASHIKYPSIEQFRTVVKNVRDAANKYGVPLPKLRFRGTVKAHGTNASVVNFGGETWHQSRERVITPISDNAGFSQYATFHRDYFEQVFVVARDFLPTEAEGAKVAIYGEWCGGNIQSGIALNQLEKMFIVFGISYGEEEARKWLDKKDLSTILRGLEEANDHKVYNIMQFPSWEIEIDFANPEAVQNELVKITETIENECPIGKTFGVSGIGEGAVWECIDPTQHRGMRFKVKGEKHSVSKVKKLVEVDVEKVANIQAFVERVLTVNRMQQMKDKLTEMELDANDVKNTGTFLKFVGQDVVKEESDTLEASGISNKEAMGKISQLARNWFLANIV